MTAGQSRRRRSVATARRLSSAGRFFLQSPLHVKLEMLRIAWLRTKARLYYSKTFAAFGERSVLFKPTMVSNPQFIFIGRNVTIRTGVRLGAEVADGAHLPEIRIGDGVSIEQDVQITGAGKIIVGKNSALAARCTIIGGFHPFVDVHADAPIKDRLSGARSVTEIGEGSLIGVGAVVKMNVKIGRHVVVGANSVVATNLPDYCLAEGNPAVIVLKYDPATDRWERPQPTGKSSRTIVE
jgi:acetyltransferase-like isoleucine patch superfamily enzyme